MPKHHKTRLGPTEQGQKPGSTPSFLITLGQRMHSHCVIDKETRRWYLSKCGRRSSRDLNR